MYDMLTSQFRDTLAREGKTITSSTGNTSYTCVFRTNSDKNKPYDRVTIFYLVTENIEQGQLLRFKDKYYLVLNQETAENDVYYKSDLLQVNTQIQTISSGYELHIKCYAEDFTSVNPVGSSQISVVGGNISFMASDNADTRRLGINSTFTALGATWKIINVYYKSGLCYIYVERIADSPTTLTYTLTVTGSDDCMMEESIPLSATAAVNDGSTTTTILNPTIVWSSSDSSIATVSNTGTVSGISAGTATITATWVEHGITATKEITVKSNVVITYTAAITPTSKNIRTNSGFTFTGAFTDSTGATAPLTAVWSLTYEDSFMAPFVTLASQTDTSVRVNVASKDDLIGYTATLHLTDSNNLCSATAAIEII